MVTETHAVVDLHRLERLLVQAFAWCRLQADWPALVPASWSKAGAIDASRIAGPAAVLLMTWLPQPLAAAPVTLEGVTFSDEEGGFTILEGRGTGRPDDPFVIVEEIHDDQRPAILTIRGVGRTLGNRLGGRPVIGFTLVKMVRNGTPRTWTSFEMELREIKSRPSPYDDGLSFAQAQGAERIYRSDRFSAAFQTDEPLDAVSFTGGVVAPGETVTLQVTITDYSPNWQFYLLQRRQVPLADASGTAANGGPDNNPADAYIRCACCLAEGS